MLCLPATDLDGAREVLDRLAEDAAASWSVGAAVAGAGDSIATVLARADSALYRHKRRRRPDDPDPAQLLADRS